MKKSDYNSTNDQTIRMYSLRSSTIKIKKEYTHMYLKEKNRKKIWKTNNMKLKLIHKHFIMELGNDFN